MGDSYGTDMRTDWRLWKEMLYQEYEQYETFVERSDARRVQVQYCICRMLGASSEYATRKFINEDRKT